MDKRLQRLTLAGAAASLADLLMPRTCIACGRILNAYEHFLCLPCNADLPLARFEGFSHNPMAIKYNERINESMFDYEPFQFATALFIYDDSSGYVNIPRNLKYHRGFAEGKHFGSILGRSLAQSNLFADVDTVVPVPLHWTRRMHRGYNQAEVIARSIASEMDRPIDPQLLIRHRKTHSQTEMSLEEKSGNVAGAFRTRRGNLPDVGHILLVDDVFTSGSTICACHDALRKVYPPKVRISAATLAVVL